MVVSQGSEVASDRDPEHTSLSQRGDLLEGSSGSVHRVGTRAVGQGSSRDHRD